MVSPPCRKSSSGRTMWAVATNFMSLTEPARSIHCWQVETRGPMTKTDSAGMTFRVGLIQMRSGRMPASNLDAAKKLIAEAKAAGADYVQTPEMTNILEAKRDALMAAIVAEERDATLAAFRELARQHALWLHVGSLALKVSPDRAVNRGFLLAPDGAIAARY